MSKSTETTPEISAVPFFARFLEEQAAPPEQPQIYTYKYPSDWEDG